ncbi:MAG: hypothetical protein KDD82_14130 [Planctomycetes bacterium]|nr:hypothetical protein [Planctomycetota bacterium]
MKTRTLGFGPGLVLWVGVATSSAAAQEPATRPVVVDTALRSLGDCPRKHVITSAEAFAKVISGLEGAPPAPDFATNHVALLIFDLRAGGAVEVGDPERVEGALRVPVVLRGSEESPAASGLRCVFLVVPRFEGGVELAQRRELGKGRGFVEKTLRATPADRLAGALPELGPDLELDWVTADGAPPPAELHLLHQVRFVKQPELEPRSTQSDVAGTRLALRFPQLQLDVEHVYAVFFKGPGALRTRNPLRITTATLGGVDAKNPPRIKHTFVLEPVPGR